MRLFFVVWMGHILFFLSRFLIFLLFNILVVSFFSFFFDRTGEGKIRQQAIGRLLIQAIHFVTFHEKLLVLLAIEFAREFSDDAVQFSQSLFILGWLSLQSLFTFLHQSQSFELYTIILKIDEWIQTKQFNYVNTVQTCVLARACSRVSRSCAALCNLACNSEISPRNEPSAARCNWKPNNKGCETNKNAHKSEINSKWNDRRRRRSSISPTAAGGKTKQFHCFGRREEKFRKKRPGKLGCEII